MKNFLRLFVFSYLAIIFTQEYIGGFFFSGSKVFIVLLIVMGLTLLQLFLSPTFNLISLPSSGAIYLFLAFIVNVIILFVFSSMLPQFDIVATTVSELNIFGFVLPSRSLTQFWSVIYSALMFTVIFNFFVWLCSGKNKK